MADKIQSQIKEINGALYDKYGHIVGHAPFDKVQIDTLTYQPLSEKVIQILSGDPSFHAEDINPDYDEEEGEWDNVNDDVEVDPIDEYTDKSDIFDLTNDLNQKIENVTATQVEEGKNKPSEAPGEAIEASNEENQE